VVTTRSSCALPRAVAPMGAFQLHVHVGGRTGEAGGDASRIPTQARGRAIAAVVNGMSPRLLLLKQASPTCVGLGTSIWGPAGPAHLIGWRPPIGFDGNVVITGNSIITRPPS